MTPSTLPVRRGSLPVSWFLAPVATMAAELDTDWIHPWIGLGWM